MKASQWLNIVLGIAVIGLGIYCLNNKNGAKEAQASTAQATGAFTADRISRIERLSKLYDQKEDSTFISYVTKTHSLLPKDFYTSPFSDINFARKYIQTFTQEEGPVLGPRQDPKHHADYTTSVWIDSATLAKWVTFFNGHDTCDGIRIYLSKYSDYISSVGDPGYDILRDTPTDRGQLNSRYSMIFAMTYSNGKDPQGNIIHRDITEVIETTEPDPFDRTKTIKKQLYPAIYNYSNLCPPYNCPTTPLQ